MLYILIGETLRRRVLMQIKVATGHDLMENDNCNLDGYNK